MKQLIIVMLILTANISMMYSLSTEPYFLESWAESTTRIIDDKEYTIKLIIKKYDVTLEGDEPDRSNPSCCLWTVTIPAQNFDAMLKIGAIKFTDIRDNTGNTRGQSTDDLLVSWHADPSIIDTDEFKIAVFLHCRLYYKIELLTDEELEGTSNAELADIQKQSLFIPSKNDETTKTPAGTPELVKIPGGIFQMGSYNGFDDEQPVHSVTVSTFYMSKYEVTFEEYDKFCDATGRSKPDDEGWGRGNRPVINVSWNNATAYCNWLSQQTGKTYRLPTEAEWEYAARSEQSYTYAGSNNISEVAWYGDNSGSRTHRVGEKKANGYGLYDMSGNVWEWCSDWYDSDYYSNSPTKNPQGASSGSYRVVRGGCWLNYAGSFRVALRNNYAPDNRLSGLGFRLVRAY